MSDLRREEGGNGRDLMEVKRRISLKSSENNGCLS